MSLPTREEMWLETLRKIGDAIEEEFERCERERKEGE